MDTGCDEDLVTYDFFVDTAIKQEQLVLIQKKHSIDFGGLEGFGFTPDFEVHHAWYYSQGMKIRRSKFYVVKDALFGLLIGSEHYSQDYGSSMLILASRREIKGTPIALVVLLEITNLVYSRNQNRLRKS